MPIRRVRAKPIPQAFLALRRSDVLLPIVDVDEQIYAFRGLKVLTPALGDTEYLV